MTDEETLRLVQSSCAVDTAARSPPHPPLRGTFFPVEGFPPKGDESERGPRIVDGDEG